jgi:PAS domain S-box-containing protein
MADLACPTLEQVLIRDLPQVSPDTSLEDTIALLEERGYIQVKKARKTGIITEKAILRAIASGKKLSETNAGEIMIRSPVTLTDTGRENALSAWTLLRQHDLEFLPVVNEKKKFLGIVTAENLIRTLDPAVTELRSSSFGCDHENPADRQRLEQDLERSRAMLEGILDSAIVSIASFRIFPDHSWEYDYYSAGCEALFGYTAEELMADKTLWMSRVFPEDLDRCLDRLYADLFAERNTSMEYRFRCQDGSIRWFISTYASRKSEEGYWTVTTTNTDITERVQAETALRERERQFQQILDSIADMVLVKDKNSRLLWANQAFRDYYGMTLEALRGIVDAPFTPPEHTRQYLRDDERVFSTGETWVIPEEPVTCRDGEVRRFSTIKAPIRDERGDVVALVGVSRDITHQKHAERKLRQREEFLSGIYHGVQQAIFGIDVTPEGDFRYLDFNPVAEQYAGITNAELQGKTPEEVFGPEIGGTFRQNYDRCLQAGTSLSYEEQVVFPGRILWTLTTLSPLRDEGGQIYRLVGTATEITAQKQAAAKLQRQLEREQLIAEITDYIRRSLDLEEVLQRTVARVRQELGTDRVIIFRFQGNDRGEVVTESVALGWMSMLATEICDPCFGDRYEKRGIWAIEDIRSSALNPCHLQLLEYFQVRANLVVPILQGEHLWGLLIAHHCTAPRRWQSEEIELLRQLALQVGIAIQQSELYQQTRQELLERQQIQSALAESEERFRSLSASAPIAIYQTNADGSCLYVNERWQEMSGLSFLDSLGDGWVQAIHPDDREALAAVWSAYLRGESEFMSDFRLLTPDGETRWVTSRVAPIRSHEGEILGYVGTDLDITDRVLAETALRESERRYAALAEASPVGIFRLNATGESIYVNQRWCEMTGRTAETGLGNEWLQTVHPDDRPRTLAAWSAWHSGDRGLPYRNELRIVRPDGGIFWMYCQIVLEIDEKGASVGFVGSLTDISDRVQAEVALQESEARFQAILEHSPAVIYLLDPENRLLFANRRYAELLSTTVDKLIGQSIFETWPGENAIAFAENNRLVLETGQLLQIEEVVPHEDGLHTYLTIKFPLRDASGQAYAVCGISTDITEKKQREEQFYRARRLESLGTLAGGIAHDLNNVLTPVLAIAQVLSLQCPDAGESTRQLLDLLESTAKRGAEMIRQILAFTRGERGKRLPVSLAPLLWEVIGIVRETFQESISVELSLGNTALDIVAADPTQLHQVMMNLLVNAKDAMPEGGTITLSAENVVVDDRFAGLNLDARAGSYVAVTVTDTGTGIPQETIERIFDPFFTTKEVGKGTGLGLSMVLAIVRDHGGFVRVTSRLGEGSRFAVYLPAIDWESFQGDSGR